MAAVKHALPNDNALRVSEVEVTFIIQVHPVGPLTKRKVSSAGLERSNGLQTERCAVTAGHAAATVTACGKGLTPTITD